ncbi:hypothetical protein MMYC01_205309 [Madurella mycetomatis]|uniref:Uncharacterized protein n=1 Tax=Madurella mycetomatis TaxID=100816 RepID=A0A175VXM0_9PEZI|nr:hypothetical protein MMYC01_205309 [Madurella mycetomatis]
MKIARTPIFRAALRPSLRRQAQPAQIRLASTGPQGSEGDKGTAKVYNKDGTNPNKNVIYLGLGALGLGGIYAMFMARPEKVASKAGEKDPEGVARQRAANSPPAR